MNLIRKLAVVIIALGSMSVAQADPVTFLFNGSIPLDGGVNPQGFGGGCGYPGNNHCGDDVFGWLTIDDEPNPIDSFWTYQDSGFPYGMVIVAGDQVGIFDELAFRIENDANSFVCGLTCDVFWMNAFSSDGSGGSFSGFFADPTGTSIEDTDLLPDASIFPAPCSNAIEGCTLRIVDSDTSWCCEFNWKFFRSPVVIPVPEPGTLALLGIGLLGMVAARRRKKA